MEYTMMVASTRGSVKWEMLGAPAVETGEWPWVIALADPVLCSLHTPFPSLHAWILPTLQPSPMLLPQQGFPGIPHHGVRNLSLGAPPFYILITDIACPYIGALGHIHGIENTNGARPETCHSELCMGRVTWPTRGSGVHHSGRGGLGLSHDLGGLSPPCIFTTNITYLLVL